MMIRITLCLVVCMTLWSAANAYTTNQCEGRDTDMRVWCSASTDRYVRIDDAFWGRLQTNTCPHEASENTRCVDHTFFPRVRDLCNGRTECRVPTDTFWVGDPCSGTYKYGNITYSCSECENILTDSTCASRAQNGECDDPATRVEMLRDCFKQCSKCDEMQSISCTNKESIENCDKWAIAGECQSNIDFMLQNCAESCRACSDTSESTKRACEGEFIDMKCEVPYFLHIDSVQYGRFDNSFCPFENASGTCNVSEAALERVRRVCLGRRDCSVGVTNNAMDPSDPCPGEAKQAAITYSCQLCQNRASDCRTRAEDGECNSNRTYMLENCFKECSGCGENVCENDYDHVNKTDVADNRDCDYWSMRGECENNPGFLHYQCGKSCATCDCKNNFGNDGACRYWASQGECEANPDWMTYQCTKACGACIECKNQHGNNAECQRWADSGECQKNPFWMRYQCAHACYSCGAKVGEFKLSSCEGGINRLVCNNPGQKIRISELFYGRRNNETCSHETFSESLSCAASAEVIHTVTDYCNGRAECVINAINGVFGDPCPGVTKQLEVTYYCQDCSDLAGSENCTNRADNDECTANSDVMLDQCFHKCTDCQENESDLCENIGSDSDCDYWGMQGECQQNPGFMNEQCARSCRVSCAGT